MAAGMRPLIPLVCFIVGCVVLTIGMFVWSIVAGLICAGVVLIGGSFVWPYVQVIPTRRLEDVNRRAAA